MSGQSGAAKAVKLNRFIVDDSNEDISVASIDEQRASDLGIFEGEYCIVKGKLRKDTLLCITSSPDCPAGHIRMSKVARKNIKVKTGDVVVLIKPTSEDPNQQSVEIPTFDKISIAAYKDTVEGINFGQSGTCLFDNCLKGFFKVMVRPARKGNTFTVDAFNRTIEFKILETSPGEYGCVSEATEIFCDDDKLLIREDDDSKLDIGYSDIGGCRQQLGLIREMVELPLRHPKIFTNLGIKPPRGILMYGPPGSGKTLIARAIANETGAYFLLINGPEIMSKMAGESEANLRKFFMEAEENAPAIIFIDEVDSIAPNRDKAGGEVEKRVVAQLLTLMDGIKSRSNVVVIAATNRPNTIDPALRRFGRFDREIDIGIPDETGRLEILEIHTKNMKKGDDVDLKYISAQTHGFVGADLQQLCTEAAMNCIREKMDLIDIEDDTIPAEVLDQMSVGMDHFKDALLKTSPSTLRETVVEVPNVKWDDIGGLEEVKKELIETVQYPLQYPELYEKFGMDAARGVLFYGPPGCGKTLLAKAVATECSANFISIKGPELLSMWVGESESNVRQIFEKARRAAPCVLFFDEIDSIVKARGASPGDSGVADRVINQLLTELDGLESKKTVFTIGATNRPDIIDPAIMRPGRLDQHVYITLPDMPGREAIFKAKMKKISGAGKIDYTSLARATENFSGADIAEVCNQAKKLALNSVLTEYNDYVRRKHKAIENGDELPREMPDNKFTVKTEHFREALRNAHASVSQQDIARYNAFRHKFAKATAPAEVKSRQSSRKDVSDDEVLE